MLLGLLGALAFFVPLITTNIQQCNHRVKLSLFFCHIFLVIGGYSFIIKEVPGNYTSQVFRIFFYYLINLIRTCACSV